MDILDCIRVRYNCEVYPLNTIIPIDPNNVPRDPPDDDQYFNITASKSVWNCQLSSESRRRPQRRQIISTNFTTHEFFNVSENSIDQISNLIPSDFGIPEFHAICMATKILDFARNMANNTHKDQKILFMAVVIEVIKTRYERHDRHHYRRPVQASKGDQSLPASKSFIEGLKTVKVEEEEEFRKCAICLEDFKVGLEEEATRMPCSHLFHKACIVSWLQRKSICPLCRFEMPIDQNDD